MDTSQPAWKMILSALGFNHENQQNASSGETMMGLICFGFFIYTGLKLLHFTCSRQQGGNTYNVNARNVEFNYFTDEDYDDTSRITSN